VIYFLHYFPTIFHKFLHARNAFKNAKSDPDPGVIFFNADPDFPQCRSASKKVLLGVFFYKETGKNVVVLTFWIVKKY
jgi:hypothetical protein